MLILVIKFMFDMGHNNAEINFGLLTKISVNTIKRLPTLPWTAFIISS